MTLDFLGDLDRTHTCGDLRPAHAGQSVVLMGWVDRSRNLGNLIFVEVRDRGGLTQVVFNRDVNPKVHARAEELSREYVVAVRGRVVERSAATVNPKLPTGGVEVVADELLLLNDARTPPFSLDDDVVLACACNLSPAHAPARVRGSLGHPGAALCLPAWKRVEAALGFDPGVKPRIRRRACAYQPRFCDGGLSTRNALGLDLRAHEFAPCRHRLASAHRGGGNVYFRDRRYGFQAVGLTFKLSSFHAFLTLVISEVKPRRPKGNPSLPQIRGRVIAMRSPGIAAYKPAERKPAANPDSIHIDGVDCVLRAGGQVAAARSNDR